MRLSTGSFLGRVLIGTLIGTTCLGGGLRAADCNRNDVEDAQDIAAGTSHDCNQNGVPDECDISPLVSFNVTSSDLEKGPTFMTSADLDGDGDKDLVIANTSAFDEPALISVLFNSGSGTFGAAQDFEVGQSPISSVAAADLDGDGDQDLAVAVFFDRRFVTGGGWVVRNTGRGTFGAPEGFGVNPNARPVSIVAADIDGDGDLDLVSGDASLSNSGGVSLLLNNGRANFKFLEIIPLGLGPARSVTASDLDRDGDLDVVFTTFGLVRILLNNGNGTFLQDKPKAAPAPADAISSVVADFDADGNFDVASLGVSTVITVARNDGDLTFSFVGTFFTSGVKATSMAAADFDRDGDVDLAVSAREGAVDDYAVFLLVNEGDGTLEEPLGFTIGAGPVSMSAADFDGNGVLDLAVVNGSDTSRTLSVLLNTTPSPVSLDRNRNRIPDECDAAPRLFHRGDANDDGKLNIADAITGLGFLFQGTSIPCKEALDANDDGQVNITDPVFVLSYLFRGGAAPAPPGPPPQACGADPEPSVHLSCDTFTSC